MNLPGHVAVTGSPQFTSGTLLLLHTRGLDRYIMTCVRHHDVTQSRYIALKILCALPVYPALPSPGGHPRCGPAGTRAVAEAPTAEGVKAKGATSSRHPGKAPQGKRRAPDGRSTEPWGQGWGPRGGSHGGGRGLPAKPDSARAWQRERGREARQCYSRHRTLGPEP